MQPIFALKSKDTIFFYKKQVNFYPNISIDYELI